MWIMLAAVSHAQQLHLCALKVSRQNRVTARLQENICQMMHPGKTNVDTRAVHIPASTCYGLPLPGTSAAAPMLHTPVTFPFWLHNLFPSQESFQCSGAQGAGSLQGREPFGSQHSLAVLLPSSGRMEDRPFSELLSTQRPLQSSNCFMCCTCDNPTFVVICLIIHNLYLFDFSLSFFFICGFIFQFPSFGLLPTSGGVPGQICQL